MGAYEFQDPVVVDLGVTKIVNPDPATVFANLTYTITVTNFGPAAAHVVTVTDTLDPTVEIVSVVTTAGSCTFDNVLNNVSCEIGLLPANANAVITVVVIPQAAVTVQNDVVVSSSYASEPDPDSHPNFISTFTVVNNPVPVIASLDPATATWNGPDFTLTVNGSNFVPGAVIRWNGADLTTFRVSAIQLTAFVPAINLALPAPGSAIITVFNPAPAGGSSNDVTLPINAHLYLPIILK
jgi:uncharacterized repeat protein (TIGR01451 family)